MLSIEEAQKQLAQLAQEALQGEEVVLTQNGTPVATVRPFGPYPIADYHAATSEERDLAWLELCGFEQSFDPVDGEPMRMTLRDEIYEERTAELARRRERNSRCG